MDPKIEKGVADAIARIKKQSIILNSIVQKDPIDWKTVGDTIRILKNNTDFLIAYSEGKALLDDIDKDIRDSRDGK